MILGGPQKLLQTIYVDDTETLEAVAVDEATGKIAVCGGPDVFIYQPYGIQHEALKVCCCYRVRVTGAVSCWRMAPRGTYGDKVLMDRLYNSGRLPIPSAVKMTMRQSGRYRGALPTSYSSETHTSLFGS